MAHSPIDACDADVVTAGDEGDADDCAWICRQEHAGRTADAVLRASVGHHHARRPPIPRARPTMAAREHRAGGAGLPSVSIHPEPVLAEPTGAASAEPHLCCSMQNPMLLSLSIRDNIKLGRSDASALEVPLLGVEFGSASTPMGSAARRMHPGACLGGEKFLWMRGRCVHGGRWEAAARLANAHEHMGDAWCTAAGGGGSEAGQCSRVHRRLAGRHAMMACDGTMMV